MEAVVSESFGEPISAGAAPRTWDSGELTLRFDSGFDLGRTERLLQEARERGGRRVVLGQHLLTFDCAAPVMSQDVVAVSNA